MNILIVDDEQTMLETLRRGLRTKGFKVFEAKNGMAALNILEQNSQINLVLTDYAMGGMNGIELLTEIRKQKKNIPVIIMTAYGDKELVIEAMRRQCDGFIDKPFTLDDLIKEINDKRD